MLISSTPRIAWRNLWRNRRRTGLALAAIGLSVALVLGYAAILRAYSDWIVETITGPMLGHVQAHASGWRKDRSLDRTVRNVSSTLAALRSDPEVASAAARVYAPALAAKEEEAFAVVVVGIDVAAESGPARLLGDASVDLTGRRAVVGRMLGELMGLREGDEIALVGQGADGSFANDLYTVTALVTTPIDLMNRQGVLINLSEAQSLFAMPDEAHEIVVHARRPDALPLLVEHVARVPGLSGAEVLDWRTLAPELVSLVQIADLAGTLVLIVVFLAASAGVANTMLMATYERTRELGMLLALGTSPSRIVRMIFGESIVLGLVGAVLGSALAIAVVAATHRTGIDYAMLTGGGPSELSFSGMRWSLRFYPSLAPIDVLRAVVAVVVTSILASIWPAVRAARLQPARALRA